MLYHLIVGTIIAANFHGNRWLMGWDGLYPELNIPLNLIRGLTAGWQEYYGAGLVGGHGFAATLPHTLIIGLFTLIIPQHLVRSVFIFLCYYLGGLGMLFVSHKLLHTLISDERVAEDGGSPRRGPLVGFLGGKPPTGPALLTWYVSLAASIYYLTNLGTIQTFYVPLEAFTVHFAALPWLTYGLILLLEKTTRKRILFFCMILLLSSIQGFIPAVFAAYGVSLMIITGVYTLMHRFGKKVLRTMIVIWSCVIAMNAYWLAPVGYFTLVQSKDYINAYNNNITTQQFVAKSIQYGQLPDAMLLKSFLWDSNELGGAILAPWKNHTALPAVTVIGYTFFGIAVAGVLISLLGHRKPLAWGLSASFLYFFGNIAIDTPPFSALFRLIQSHSPELVQAFRTTFTKFGIGLSFHYSLFIAVGLYALIRLASLFTKRIAIDVLVPACMALSLILFSFPLWQGKLIYQKLLVDLPPQYIQLTRYLNTLPKGKIADFPQDCSEGWYNQLWGYFGSGFLWYGVEHPMMARAFDVWSHTNENYYWELSTALRQQDYLAIERVFEKYSVRYILYDNNITHCRSQKGFLSSLDFGAYLETSGMYTKRTTFSAEKLLPVIVYERNTRVAPPVAILHNAPNVLPTYQYNDTDRAFTNTSAYITDPLSPADLTDPSRLQFSKRGTPLSKEMLGQLVMTPVATMSATASESVPCQTATTDDHALVSRGASGDVLRLMTTNAFACQKFTFTDINTTDAFVLAVQSRHIAGEPLLVSITNKGRPAGMDIQVPKHTDFGIDYYFLPPTFPSEVELTITLSNASYNQYTSINDLESITLYSLGAMQTLPVPETEKSITTLPKQISHPISGLYVIDLPPGESTGILTLNQSFDPGWKAFDANRTELQDHILVNNWANGWRLTGDNRSVIIIFLPQLLEYLGFLLFLIPGILVWRTKT